MECPAGFSGAGCATTVGARVVVLLGGLLQGFGLVLASQVQSLPLFLVAYGVVGGFGVGAICHVPVDRCHRKPGSPVTS